MSGKHNLFLIEGKILKCSHYLSNKRQRGFRLLLVQTNRWNPVPFPLFGFEGDIINAGDHVRMSGHISGFKRTYVKYEVDSLEVTPNGKMPNEVKECGEESNKGETVPGTCWGGECRWPEGRDFGDIPTQ